jgi:hypothetical protein
MDFQVQHICEKCGREPAVVHILISSEEGEDRRHYCVECGAAVWAENGGPPGKPFVVPGTGE